jgi:hypothetical protein
MFRENLPLQSRQHSIKIGDDISGGPDADNSYILTRLENYKRRANGNINAAILRLEQSKNMTAINLTYLDGIEVRDGEAYYCRRVHFQLIPKITLVSVPK